MKTTKAQARDAYDSFFSILRCFNGGTSEENARSAPHCLETMEKEAAEVAILAANPNKALAADAWMMEALSVTIPARVASFKERYASALARPDNVIPFTLAQ